MIIWLRKLFPYIFYSSKKEYIESTKSILYCYNNLEIKKSYEKKFLKEKIYIHITNY